jgi:hypothetical protein
MDGFISSAPHRLEIGICFLVILFACLPFRQGRIWWFSGKKREILPQIHRLGEGLTTNFKDYTNWKKN